MGEAPEDSGGVGARAFKQDRETRKAQRQTRREAAPDPKLVQKVVDRIMARRPIAQGADVWATLLELGVEPDPARYIATVSEPEPFFLHPRNRR